MKIAEYFESLEFKKVQCRLCPHECNLSPGQKGRCKSRINLNGVLYSLNYGNTVTVNPFDPVEKKPLFHFRPGKQVLSIGSNYCNLRCNYCQNYSISQNKAKTQSINVDDLDQLMKQYSLEAIAFTYTEPVIWYEFVKDCSIHLHNREYKTIMVSNGFINPEPLQSLLPHIDAFNIDLKSIDDDFYRRNCSGSVEPVKETIKIISGNAHIEITNLLITNENDSNEQIDQLIDFVYSINPSIPLHFSKYYPCYKLTNPPTDEERLFYAYKRAKKKLKHVYIGNIHFSNYLYCDHCGEKITERGYVMPVNMKNGKCPKCGNTIYGNW